MIKIMNNNNSNNNNNNNNNMKLTNNDESHEGYFLEVDVQYPENLHNLHNDLYFLPERMKIEKVEKLNL